MNIKTKSNNNNNNTFSQKQEISVRSSKDVDDLLSIRITTFHEPFTTSELSAIKVPTSALPKNQSNISVGSLVYGKSNLFRQSLRAIDVNGRSKGDDICVKGDLQLFKKIQIGSVKSAFD